MCGSSSPGRATASQAVGSGFESRLPLMFLKLFDNYKLHLMIVIAL